MSRYSVLIDLNTSGVDELNKIERQILQLQTQGNKPINLKIDVDGNIKNITSMFDNIEKQAAQSGKNISKALQKGMKGFTFNSKDLYFDEFFKQLKADEKNIQKLISDYHVDPKDAKKAYVAYRNEFNTESKRQETENRKEREKKNKQRQKDDELHLKQIQKSEDNKKRIEAQQRVAAMKAVAKAKNSHRDELVQQGIRRKNELLQQQAANRKQEAVNKKLVEKNQKSELNQASKQLETLKKNLSKTISKNDYADSTSMKEAQDLMQMLDSTNLDDYTKPLKRVEELTNRVNQSTEKLSQSHKNTLDQLNKEIDAEESAAQLADQMAKGREQSELKRKQQEEKSVQAQNDAINKSLEERQKILASINKRANSGEFELRNAKIDAFEAKYDGQNNDALNRVKNTIQEIKLLQTELQTGIYESGDKKGLQIIGDDQIAKMNQLDTAIDKLNNGMKEVGVTMSKSIDPSIIQRSIDSVDTYMKNNTRALKDYKDSLNDIKNEYRNAKTEDDRLNADKNFKNLQAEISAKGLSGKSFTSELGRAFTQISEFVGVYGILQNLVYEVPAKMIQAVQDVNAAQIELTKVSNAPTSELSVYWDEAAVSAKKYGSTISDVISSTADWQRLGYDFEASKKLSDATTLMQKVGDNMTQESASKGIISTLSGFKMDADEVTKVIDVVNEIANTQPIDTAGIFEGLERSASSMNAANNSLEQTVALLSAANSVVQNPAELGTAFKTISMRLRGATTDLQEAGLDTEGMAESTAKLREEIIALSGVDIMLDESTFKNSYQILDELSQKWEDLSDIQQASLTELVAGKHQGNIMSALMENFDIARNALNTALNDSEGSAEQELENWNQGIEASLSHFQAQFQQFSTSSISSDFFKGIVDGGTEALNILTQIVDTFGLMAPIAGAFMTRTGKGKRNAALYKIKLKSPFY